MNQRSEIRYIDVSWCIATIHIAKSLEKPTSQAKLVKEYCCPNAEGKESTGIQQKLNFMGADEQFESLVQLRNTSKPIKIRFA